AKSEDTFEGPAARLIEAVLQFRPSSPTAMSPIHAAYYREWRGLLDHHFREFGSSEWGDTLTPEVEAKEDRMGAHMEIIDALGDRIFATPAQAPGDVLPYAEVCYWRHWSCDPQAPDV